jgi:hypothetical protein
MPRRKLYDYAGELHRRGLSTDTHRPFIMEVIRELMKSGEYWSCKVGCNTWQERANAGRRAIVAEIDRRKGIFDVTN